MDPEEGLSLSCLLWWIILFQSRRINTQNKEKTLCSIIYRFKSGAKYGDLDIIDRLKI